MNFLDLRPAKAIELYWRELLSIEEDAEVLEPVYFTFLGDRS